MSSHRPPPSFLGFVGLETSSAVSFPITLAIWILHTAPHTQGLDYDGSLWTAQDARADILKLCLEVTRRVWTPANTGMAEGAGFEPARRFITVYTLSRHAPSTARPPLLPAGHTTQAGTAAQ